MIKDQQQQQKGNYLKMHVGHDLAMTSYCWLLLCEQCDEQNREPIEKQERWLLQKSGVINPENKI